eukprot:GHVU01186328.1.p1 GENE.GHVU01186328.1~~GHVU01186328.1.p1  ORF type:complete len:288 (-),score=14.80 GHVU01186328.1:740-1603(-)
MLLSRPVGLFDTGLLPAAGVQRELYRVDDFASDELVLKLCSADTITKLHAKSSEEEGTSLAVTGLTLFFVRLFMIAVNSKQKICDMDRVALLWCSLLWLTSLAGMHPTTKRNVVVSVLGSVLLCVQRKVPSPRLCTTESLEHMFGNFRQWRREFTVKEFVEHSSKLETTFRNMMRHNIIGPSSSRGYLSGFSSYTQHLDMMVANRATSVNRSSNSEVDAGSSCCETREGVDVDYECSRGVSVGAQIEERVLTAINKVCDEMLEVLGARRCPHFADTFVISRILVLLF